MINFDHDPDDYPSVTVLRSHLEEWEQVLRWAHGHHSAYDLAENYRQGRPNMKLSRLTTLLERIHNRIEGYLNELDITDGLQDE